MKSSKKKLLNVLLLDDEEQILNLNELVLSQDFQIHKAKNIVQANKILKSYDINIIVSDHFIGNENGLNFLVELHKSEPEIVKIIFSSCTCHEVILQSHNSLAIFRYLTKPCKNEDLLENVKLAEIAWDISICDKKLKEEHSQISDSLNEISLIELKSQKKIESLKLFSKSISSSIVYLGLGAFLTGITSFLVLYCLKSFLGIDLLK